MSSISATPDQFILDLKSNSINIKIQHIEEESVKVATDAAIQATQILTRLLTIINRKVDIIWTRKTFWKSVWNKWDTLKEITGP